jgi:glycosyltransferase involved in cell wall biosynthesis
VDAVRAPDGRAPERTAPCDSAPMDEAGADAAQRGPRLVSVVVPVRDGAEHIHRQLDALSDQTYRLPWEVVVADNGSTDGTAEVARRWEGRLPGLRVVDASAGRGVGPARNQGTRASCGDAVLYCDADDRCVPEWVERMADALTRHPIVGGPCAIEDPDGSRLPASERLATAFDVVPTPIGGNFGVRRSVFDEVGGFDEHHPDAHAEDAEFALRAWERGHEAAFAAGALVIKSRKPDARSTFHQWRGYGIGAMHNALLFRDRGLPRLLVRQEVRLLGWLLAHPGALRTREGRLRWLRWVAGRVGWLEALWRYRRMPIAPRPPNARPFPAP